MESTVTKIAKKFKNKTKRKPDRSEKIMKYRAFAIMKNLEKEWRVNIFDYDTEEEAKEGIERYARKYKEPCLYVKCAGIEKVY